MESVVRFTLRQQVLFNLIFVLLMLVGLFAVSDLPVERYPHINFGRVIVTTIYPGASPRDVEALVTIELEQALEGLEEIEYVRATSVRERSTITVKFRDDTDYQRLYDELRFRVLGALGELPPESSRPDSSPDRHLLAWLPVGLGQSDRRALQSRLDAARRDAAGPLARIPGVDEAEIVGELTREFQVALDPGKLAVHGVTFEDVARGARRCQYRVARGRLCRRFR